jgi:ABC-type lipoprotein release transport system permease subunit
MELQQLIGEQLICKTRFEQNELLFKTLKSEKWWTFLILAFIIVIGTFNIVGSITMLMIEKKKDMSVLTVMGADSNLVRKIFLTEGFFIGLIGAVSGLLLGLLICYLQIKYQFVPFSEGFVVKSYPVKIMFSDVVYIFSTVMFIGFLAAWYPVRSFTKNFEPDFRSGEM